MGLSGGIHFENALSEKIEINLRSYEMRKTPAEFPDGGACVADYDGLIHRLRRRRRR